MTKEHTLRIIKEKHKKGDLCGMRKKRIISFSIVVVLLFVFIFVPGYIKNYEEEKRQQELEDAIFDSQITAQYGSEDYLGRLDKKIVPYPIKIRAYPNGTKGLEGRYNMKKITNIYEAREVIYLLGKTLGIPNERDIFLYGDSQSFISETDYRFSQFYKGVWVETAYMIVRVDLEGNTVEIDDGYEPEEMIARDIESIEPKYTKEDVEKMLKEKYPGREMRSCALYITRLSRYIWDIEEDRYVLVWIARIGRGHPLQVCIDANTGEIIDEDDGIICG